MLLEETGCLSVHHFRLILHIKTQQMQGFMREREAFPTQLDRQAAKSQDESWNREAMSNPTPFDTQRGLRVSEPEL